MMRWRDERDLMNACVYHMRAWLRLCNPSHPDRQRFGREYVHMLSSSEMGNVHGILTACSYLASDETHKRLKAVWERIYSKGCPPCNIPF